VEEDFYTTYPDFRAYDPPVIKSKHVKQFDYEFWKPANCRTDCRVLEIGCGTGLFLAYLERKGVSDFAGIDADEKVLTVLPDSLKARVTIQDIWAYLGSEELQGGIDRVALFDVFEHFSPHEGVRLLTTLKEKLAPDARIVMRVPNMSSPWGLQYQYHDLTHKAAYTPGSLQQVALAAGYDVLAALPQRRRRGVRRGLENTVNWILDHTLTEPPPIWSANFIAVLSPAAR